MESIMDENSHDAEVSAIVSRYALRDADVDAQRFSWLRPNVHLSALENDRIILEFFLGAGFTDFRRVSLLEVGCGGGDNLLRFLRWGFDPAYLVGNELLPERLEAARRMLPPEVRLIGGDACALDCGRFDVVYQSTVFSTILDEAFRVKLAKHMWNMTKPGGAVLWYDLCFNNPKNRNIRGTPMHHIRELFPESEPVMRRVTLAPPISRTVTRVSPRLHSLLNALPMLRTHALCWIGKPLQRRGR
jgi:SAM-dependent methyltransferase